MCVCVCYTHIYIIWYIYIYISLSLCVELGDEPAYLDWNAGRPSQNNLYRWSKIPSPCLLIKSYWIQSEMLRYCRKWDTVEYCKNPEWDCGFWMILVCPHRITKTVEVLQKGRKLSARCWQAMAASGPWPDAAKEEAQKTWHGCSMGGWQQCPEIGGEK